MIDWSLLFSRYNLYSALATQCSVPVEKQSGVEKCVFSQTCSGIPLRGQKCNSAVLI